MLAPDTIWIEYTCASKIMTASTAAIGSSNQFTQTLFQRGHAAMFQRSWIATSDRVRAFRARKPTRGVVFSLVLMSIVGLVWRSPDPALRVMEDLLRLVDPRKPVTGVVFPAALRSDFDIVPDDGTATIGSLMSGACRVVVISSTTCPGSKMLAKNWWRVAKAAMGQQQGSIHAGWIVFGPLGDAFEPFSLVPTDQSVPPFLSHFADKQQVRAWF